jgi:hypothetical protein
MKGEKGVTVMIGLLGPGKEMGKESDSLLEDDYSECPLATQDEIVNKGNKQKAILPRTTALKRTRGCAATASMETS